MESIRNRKIGKEDLLSLLYDSIIALVLSFLCNLMLNLSLEPYRNIEWITSNNTVASSNIVDNIIGTFLIFFFLMIFISFAKNHGIVVIVASSVFFIISLIDYYEIMFHGTVLTYEDVKNIGTATAVLGEYDFTITTGVLKIIAVFVLLIIFGIVLIIARHRSIVYTKREHHIIRTIVFAGITVYFFIICYGPGDPTMRTDLFCWERYYLYHGYVTGTIEFTLTTSINKIREPIGYSTSVLEDYQGTSASTDDYPDIIFILNETWYDLDHYSPTNADSDYMANYHMLDAIKGYACVPISGGGTNNSEFELLTSDSLTLINTISPFNNLDMRDFHSAVDYLESLGYCTMAAHPEAASNYHRSNGWPGLGFDEVHFEPNFTHLEYYGQRVRATDSSAFADFIYFYENMPSDQPRFAFFLTIQNHGGWNSNPSNMDTVHIGNNTIWDEVSEEANEYLSTIQLTDQFINEITEYFSSNNRNVIVLMVGDHAPSLINDVLVSRDDSFLLGRETPYFIWSNYSNLNSSVIDHPIDICCLAPLTFREAGLPLSPYYVLLNDVAEQTRCFTCIQSSLGYLDSEGEINHATDTGELNQLVRDYFYMEFNNISPETRNEFFFSPST